MRCQCDAKGELIAPSTWYDPEKELPYVEHEPGECKCTNEIKKYKRADGNEMFLCSNCCMTTDRAIE